MQNLGYKRVSTTDQNTARQLDGLSVSIDKWFVDECSGATRERPALSQMKEHAREGDVIHVHDISRLARDIGDLIALVEQFNASGVTVVFHKESMTFTGDKDSEKGGSMNKLLLGVLGSVYEFERAMMLERQREGIAKAKEAGKYKGGKPTADRAGILESLAGGLSIRKTAAKHGVSASTVQRVKAEATAS